MGNGWGRPRRNESSVYGPQQMYSLPPGPVSYTSLPPYNPTRYPPPYYSNYNGSVAPPGPSYYPPGTHQGGRHDYPMLPPPPGDYWQQSSSASPPLERSLSAPQQQSAQTVTIRNAVNIQKNTIKLIEDSENAGFYLLSFAYDADSPGSFNIFYFAKEDWRDGSIKPWNPNVFSPVRLTFEKGSGKKFEQASGTGIYLDAFDPSLLEKEQPVEGCPLVIRAQINVQDGQPDSSGMAEDIGAALPKSVNSQITQALIERTAGGDCKVRVLRQIIWVDGVRYELKELYGVENTVDKSDIDEEDFGKECVICMSDPRDTAVMPCRHMCMCNGCASTFKSQMNRCPICRQPVEALLKIML
ncbi:hypothetical protein L7F22_013213 [Adiantum nelumboides]|nr:hypothetical protein [Adiantum nelumboides]